MFEGSCLSCYHEYADESIGKSAKTDDEYYDEYGNKKSYGSLKSTNQYYYGEYDEIYYWDIKPRKVPVIIEELDCDPKNLAHGASLKYTLIPTKTELKLSGRKWQVEIFD